MNKQHENLNPADERQPQESFGSQMLGHIKTSVIATIVLAVIVSRDISVDRLWPGSGDLSQQGQWLAHRQGRERRFRRTPMPLARR